MIGRKKLSCSNQTTQLLAQHRPIDGPAMPIAIGALRSAKLNKSVFSLFRRLSTPHLLLSAGACSTAPAARPQLSIDISCP